MAIEMAMSYELAVHKLGAWGYIDSNNVANLLIKNTSEDALKGAIVEFKSRWGAKYGLSKDDSLDEKTAELMNRRFCDCRDGPLSVAGNVRRWDSNRLTWCGSVTVGSLSFLTAQQFTRDETARVCGMRLTISGPSGGLCNILSDEGDIDGPGGTLARAFLPGFPSSGATTQLTQEFDTGEAGGLDQDGFNIVTLHETGHSLGLDHNPDNDGVVAVMDPFFNPSLTGWLPADVEELQLRYGPPGSAGPDTGPGNPVEEMCPELFSVARLVAQAGERGAERALKRATGN